MRKVLTILVLCLVLLLPSGTALGEEFPMQTITPAQQNITINIGVITGLKLNPEIDTEETIEYIIENTDIVIGRCNYYYDDTNNKHIKWSNGSGNIIGIWPGVTNVGLKIGNKEYPALWKVTVKNQCKNPFIELPAKVFDNVITIKFNNNVGFFDNNFYSNSVFVIDCKNITIHPTSLVPGDRDKTILKCWDNTPGGTKWDENNHGYFWNNNEYLYITDNIKDINGNSLKQPIRTKIIPKNYYQ